MTNVRDRSTKPHRPSCSPRRSVRQSPANGAGRAQDASAASRPITNSDRAVTRMADQLLVLAAVPEARVDDVVEERSEAVAHAEGEAELVAALELAHAQQHFLRRRAAARQRELIVLPRGESLEVDRQAADDAERDL